MAYRKRRDAATSATERPPSGTRTASEPDLAPIVLAIAHQLKQLLDEMESIKKRLADLEAQALVQLARPTPMVEQAREVVQTLQSIVGAGQAPRNSESAAPSATAAPAAPESSIQSQSVPVQSASPHPEDSITKLPPWMAASPKDATRFVPQWTLWSPDFLDHLNTRVERLLGNVPDMLAAQGETQAAEKMRQWLASDKPLALQVALLMARRIVATSPTARESAKQRSDLAMMLLRDLEDSLPRELPEDKQRIIGILSQKRRLIVLLSVFLTVALRGLAGAPATSNV